MATSKRLMRGIYKRGNVYWLAVQKEKKRHFISLGTDDPHQAMLKAAKLRHSPAIESGSLIKHAVDRFIAFMIAEKNWSRGSKDSRGYVLKAFAERCGAVTPGAVTFQQIKRYHAERLKSCSESTAYSGVGVVSRFFDWCRDEEKTIRENPCDPLKLAYPEKAPRKSFCTPAMADCLLDACPREDLKFVLFCGFHGGMRPIEIVEAVPWWFDLANQQIHFRKTPTCRFKDREERSVPITDKFAAFLADYGLREPFMLHPEKAHAKSRYRYDFNRPFREYMATCAFCCGHFTRFTGKASCIHCHKSLASMRWVTPHIMRHTFASLLASAGESIYIIAAWLGDDVRTTQDTYAKLLPIRGKVDSAFQPSPSKSDALNESHAASNITRSYTVKPLR